MPLGERAGIAAIFVAIFLGFLDLRLAVFPLAAFVMMCVAAPFFPRTSFYLPVISRGSPGQRVVALTFDDGPDPETTPELLRLLEKHNTPATFFVIGEKAAAYPELIRAIAAAGHTIGNHSCRHDSLLLMKGAKEIANDIMAVQSILKRLGVTPLIFRPPAGITAPGLRKALMGTGMYTVNFSCRAFDRGNKRIRHLAKRILRRVRPGDIILLHDTAPPMETSLPAWIHEVEKILQGLNAAGLAVRPLSEVIAKPVMAREYRLCAHRRLNRPGFDGSCRGSETGAAANNGAGEVG